eukprot:g41325.t1
MSAEERGRSVLSPSSHNSRRPNSFSAKPPAHFVGKQAEETSHIRNRSATFSAPARGPVSRFQEETVPKLDFETDALDKAVSGHPRARTESLNPLCRNRVAIPTRFQVYVRNWAPPSQSNIFASDEDANITSGTTQVTFMASASHQRKFSFDGYFDHRVDNANLFHALGQNAVKVALQGQSVNLLCYGPHGSGKSYTLEGKTSLSSTENGLVFRCTDALVSSLPAQNAEDTSGAAPLRCAVFIYQVKAGSTPRDMLRNVKDSVPELGRVQGTGALLGFVGVQIYSMAEFRALWSLHFCAKRQTLLSQEEANHSFVTLELRRDRSSDVHSRLTFLRLASPDDSIAKLSLELKQLLLTLENKKFQQANGFAARRDGGQALNRFLTAHNNWRPTQQGRVRRHTTTDTQQDMQHKTSSDESVLFLFLAHIPPHGSGATHGRTGASKVLKTLDTAEILFKAHRPRRKALKPEKKASKVTMPALRKTPKRKGRKAAHASPEVILEESELEQESSKDASGEINGNVSPTLAQKDSPMQINVKSPEEFDGSFVSFLEDESLLKLPSRSSSLWEQHLAGSRSRSTTLQLPDKLETPVEGPSAALPDVTQALAEVREVPASSAGSIVDEPTSGAVSLAVKCESLVNGEDLSQGLDCNPDQVTPFCDRRGSIQALRRSRGTSAILPSFQHNVSLPSINYSDVSILSDISVADSIASANDASIIAIMDAAEQAWAHGDSVTIPSPCTPEQMKAMQFQRLEEDQLNFKQQADQMLRLQVSEVLRAAKSQLVGTEHKEAGTYCPFHHDITSILSMLEKALEDLKLQNHSESQTRKMGELFGLLLGAVKEKQTLRLEVQKSQSLASEAEQRLEEIKQQLLQTQITANVEKTRVEELEKELLQTQAAANREKTRVEEPEKELGKVREMSLDNTFERLSEAQKASHQKSAMDQVSNPQQSELSAVFSTDSGLAVPPADFTVNASIMTTASQNYSTAASAVDSTVNASIVAIMESAAQAWTHEDSVSVHAPRTPEDIKALHSRIKEKERCLERKNDQMLRIQVKEVLRAAKSQLADIDKILTQDEGCRGSKCSFHDDITKILSMLEKALEDLNLQNHSGSMTTRMGDLFGLLLSTLKAKQSLSQELQKSQSLASEAEQRLEEVLNQQQLQTQATANIEKTKFEELEKELGRLREVNQELVSKVQKAEQQEAELSVLRAQVNQAQASRESDQPDTLSSRADLISRLRHEKALLQQELRQKAQLLASFSQMGPPFRPRRTRDKRQKIDKISAYPRLHQNDHMHAQGARFKVIPGVNRHQSGDIQPIGKENDESEPHAKGRAAVLAARAGCSPIKVGMRSFIQEETLFQIRPNGRKPLACDLLLFSDILVYRRHSKSAASQNSQHTSFIANQNKEQHVIQLGLCRLLDLSPCLDFPHALRIISPQRTFTVACASQEQKSQWLRLLEAQIKENCGMLPLGPSSSKEDVQSDSKQCRLCFRPYSFMNRQRRVCAQCTINVCCSCCKREVADLPQQATLASDPKAKTCDRCFGLKIGLSLSGSVRPGVNVLLQAQADRLKLLEFAALGLEDFAWPPGSKSGQKYASTSINQSISLSSQSSRFSTPSRGGDFKSSFVDNSTDASPLPYGLNADSPSSSDTLILELRKTKDTGMWQNSTTITSKNTRNPDTLKQPWTVKILARRHRIFHEEAQVSGSTNQASDSRIRSATIRCSGGRSEL